MPPPPVPRQVPVARLPQVVFVVEDDGGMRDAVSSVLRSVGYEVEVFGSAGAFMERALGNPPGCAILDVRLPGIGGMDLQRKLAESGVRLPIIFITGHGDIRMTVKAMRLGAVEFLPKPFREQDLLDAVHAALARDAQQRLEDDSKLAAAAQISRLAGLQASLSRREREVMDLVVQGLLNKQIAARLDLSEITVKLHRGRMMKKLEVTSVVQLVRLADALKASAPPG